MRFGKLRSVVGLLALAMSAGLAHAANNPAYDSWAKHKPGTSVTLKTISEAAGQKTETEITYVLDEVTPEKAVVEVKTSMVVAGNPMQMPARKMDIPASGAAGSTAPSTANTPNVKQSDEKVTIGGKAYDCHVVEATSDTNGMKITSKNWTSPEVPNLLVKTESSSTGAVASKTTMEVTKLDLK